jgi:hypothetical protein
MNIGSNPVLDSGRRDSALRLLENLFLMLTALYLAYAMKGMTMFKPVIPESFSPNLMLVMELLVLALLMLRRHEHRDIWLGLALVGVYVMSYRTLGRDTVLFTAILVMGLEGVDYRRIIRTYFVAVGGVLVATIMAGMAGGIENLVYIREGLRSCWGTAYPTDFSTAVLFLAMGMWIAWPELPDWAMLIFGLVPLALAAFITASRNSVDDPEAHKAYPSYARSLQSIEKDETGGLKPEYLAGKISRIVRKRNPNYHYIISTLEQRLSVFLKAILPPSWFAAILGSYYHL